ncbi:unnamed protein product [Rotaria sp. Silwood1]|nr:unnamed protein product [Rotaria sp. Silwood1]CAF4716218.1 unnamed protein product [Rotaria sp. Silwood1]
MSTHQLGTETMTKINLVIHGNVGTKAPGQSCIFDCDQSDTDADKNSGSKANQTIKQGSTKSNGASSVKIVRASAKDTVSIQQKKVNAKKTTISEDNNDDMDEDGDQ